MYYLEKSSGEKNVNSRGEKENTINPLQKVTDDIFLVCQVKGVKKILLFTPRQQSSLYPSKLNPTLSEANFWKDPLINFPLLQDTTYIEIEAYPGHMISIPKNWWWTSINMDESFSSYISLKKEQNKKKIKIKKKKNINKITKKLQ